MTKPGPPDPEAPEKPDPQEAAEATAEPAALRELRPIRPTRPVRPIRPIRPTRPVRPTRPEIPTRSLPPSPLEGGLRERRAQRQKLVADLIAEHKSIRSQNEIQDLLQEQGVLATQSSISRDLRDLGVRRVKGVYVIKPSRSGGWSFDDVIELVEMVSRSGPYTTVIQTTPGAGRLVARTLEEVGWEEVVGTVADDGTIFVATRTEEDQDRLFERFKKYLSV